MGAVLTGIVRSSRVIGAEDDSYQFLALDIVTERGVAYVCQVWDIEQISDLVGHYGDKPLLDHRVKVTLLNYSIGTRKFKDGSSAPQVRFRISNVRDLGLPDEEE